MRLIYSFTFFVGVTLNFINATSQSLNTPPTISFDSPSKDFRFQWNSIVPYQIKIVDAEDGNSAYGEILSNEIILFVTYLPDSSLKKSYLSKQTKSDLSPLRLMMESGCFTCHTAKSKLIGPPFEAVAKRYPNNPKNVEAIAQKIINGATGTWGEPKMPPHPDLKTEKVKQIVNWILSNNLDPSVTYFAGMEGAFRTKEKGSGDSGKGIYILMAHYLDHGVMGKDRKQGTQTIVLKN
jgi:cytochrome c